MVNYNGFLPDILIGQRSVINKCLEVIYNTRINNLVLEDLPNLVSGVKTPVRERVEIY